MRTNISLHFERSNPIDAEEEVDPGTPEGDRFTMLVMMIEAYENQNYPIPLPDFIAAIKSAWNNET